MRLLCQWGIPAKTAELLDCTQPIHRQKVNAAITTRVTKLLGVLILLAAVPSSPPAALLDPRSAKGPAEFTACFADAQGRNGQAWAFMPAEHGGTFTDSGAYGAPASYWLKVRSIGASTRLRISAGAPSSVIRAVEQCR